MVKFAASLLIAALIAAPAFAFINWDQIDTRELSDELLGREFTDVEVKREDGEYVEIDARDLEAFYQRYAEELEARTPDIFRHIFQDGMKRVKAIAHYKEKKKEAPAEEAVLEPEVRDFDDLSERDFFDDNLVERDLDLDLEFVERDFDEDLYEREYNEDLYERDFERDLEERSFDGLD